MSKFDKFFTRRIMLNDPEYCSQPVFVGFKKDEDDEYELNDDGNKIPLFDQCGKKMKPKKMKNFIKWTCRCGGSRYIPREPQTYSKVDYVKEVNNENL